ncbi:MAG: hypothetical protein IT330_15835 [Anaerolineae bacterium]|nr:hypothetical protein [Anaerolineae bacterium]
MTAAAYPGQTLGVEKVVRDDIYDGYQAASIEEAVSRLHFPVVVPKVLPAGYRLDAIYTPYPEDTVEALKLIYTNGKYRLVVGQQPRKEPAPNLSDEYMAELRQERVTVGSHLGMAHGPRTSQTKEARPVYAAVTWYPPGLMRLVGSVDDPTLTLEDILAVARSMEEP